MWPTEHPPSTMLVKPAFEPAVATQPDPGAVVMQETGPATQSTPLPLQSCSRLSFSQISPPWENNGAHTFPQSFNKEGLSHTWLVWLHGLSAVLQSKGSLVRFPVRAYT